MRKILLLLKLFVIVVAFASVQTSYAQLQRLLPANGKRGVTGEQRPLPVVIINGEAAKLAPGGIIVDTNNRTILHQNLPANADIWFQLGLTGDIQRIYLLTPEERARFDQAKK
ncbi:MAG: hypothetical protein ABL891_14715 [Burkholderiales bacterium]